MHACGISLICKVLDIQQSIAQFVLIEIEQKSFEQS
jgi:hypothetical protein